MGWTTYTYPTLLGWLVRQQVINPMMGRATDEAAVERVLADLLLAPIMGYVSMTRQPEPLLGEAPALKRWWEAVSERPSFRDTPLK